MATTIQISEELMTKLKTMKLHDNESYEDLIWDIIEDIQELSTETKKSITQAEQEIKEGKTIPFEEVKKKLKL